MEPQTPFISPGFKSSDIIQPKDHAFKKVISHTLRFIYTYRLLVIVMVTIGLATSVFVGFRLESQKSPAAPVVSKQSTSRTQKKDSDGLQTSSNNLSGTASTSNTKTASQASTSPTTTTSKSTNSSTSSSESSNKSSGSSGKGVSNDGGSSGGSGGGGGFSASSEYIISTLYAYPTLASWTQVEDAAPTVSSAIVNICAPNGSGSGCNGQPANAINPDWTSTISELKNAGIKPLFYISTNYGATALSVIEGEIQNAISWYGVASPMFDTMEPSGTCTNGGSPLPCTTYYDDLYTYAVGVGASTVEYNPGTTYNVTSADMFGTNEVLQVFEGTAASFESTSFPSWMSAYSANEFAATLSAGSSSTIGADVSDAIHDGIGNFYEDDENEPPNYSTLPAYWSTEVSDVNSGT